MRPLDLVFWIFCGAVVAFILFVWLRMAVEALTDRRRPRGTRTPTSGGGFAEQPGIDLISSSMEVSSDVSSDSGSSADAGSSGGDFSGGGGESGGGGASGGWND